MSELMNEALAALNGKIELSPAKIPAGKSIIAVKLDRDASRSGQRMTAVGRDWLVSGMAVAICGGHVVESNYVFGRFTNGMPKVSACHFVVCPKCGRRTLEPLAVWEAKDTARKAGVEVDRGMPAIRILEKYGSCPCGAKWQIDLAGEKKELGAFADETLKAVESMPEITAFLPPAAFSVLPEPGGEVGAEWTWLKEAMAASGRGVAPFQKDAKGDVIVYNPGFWLGYVDDVHSTGLFWVEGGRGRRNLTPPSFNPGEVNGL